MRRSIPVLLTTALAVATLVALGAPSAVAAGSVQGDPLTGSGSVARTQLTAAQLTSATATATVPNSAFALPENAAPPLASFEGTLTLNGVATAGGFSKVKDTARYSNTEARKHLPPFSVKLVQNGSHLIPVVRGLQITGSPVWNLAVAPGRAWSEAGDGSWTRASLPFALIERNANCVHNGVMTFLFTANAVSQVRYQVTSETCVYFQFDMWGQVDASYTPGGISSAEAVRDAYVVEVAGRIPTKPIGELASDNPGTGVDPSVFGSGPSASALTTFGFLHDGVNYVGTCPTRQGAYPYCAQLLLPSYSTAKSVLGGMGFMRLAQKYGLDVVNEALSAHIPEATGSAWNGVTIGHALDMATGNYKSNLFQSDEGGAVMLDFFLTESYAERLSISLSWPRKATPGTNWNYHTSDTFLATLAMDSYLKTQAGAGADLFSMLRDEVLIPAGVGPDALTTVRTGNSASGAPFGGYGLFWTQDDIAKVAKLLTVDHGVAGGTQILHPGLLDASLQADSADRGLTTSGNTAYRYNNGYWARDFNTSLDPIYTTPFAVPFMSGYGGITVALMPNGSSYYEFSDGSEFAWIATVKESNKLAPMVEGDPGGGGGGGGSTECSITDAIVNGGFETGSASPWFLSGSASVAPGTTSHPTHSGSYKVLMSGVGDNSLATLSQAVTIPADCTNATLRFWLRVVTEEVLMNNYDKLDLEVTDADGDTVRLVRWSNQDAGEYALKSIPLGQYAGQTITITFTGDENLRRATWFAIDDVTLPLAG